MERHYNLLPPEGQSKKQYAPTALANAKAAYRAASFAHLESNPLYPVSLSSQVLTVFTLKDFRESDLHFRADWWGKL